MFQKNPKDINVKGFNMTRNKNEDKVMTEHVSCDCKCKFNSKICNSNQKWNSKTCKCEGKNYRTCKKGYSQNRSTCICENNNHITIDNYYFFPSLCKKKVQYKMENNELKKFRIKNCTQKNLILTTF